jgi:tight adherence protein C
VLERLSGSPSLTRKRLEASGSNATVEQFRAQQLVCSVLGLAGGLFFALLAALRGHTSLVVLLAMVGLGGVTGIVVRDWLLTQRVNRRRNLIMVEFPTVADLLALAVGAGEGPLAAMERVAAVTSGELAMEFRRAIGDIRAGAAVPTALSQMAGRVDLLPFTRFVDGMVVSLGRGTPLAAVLRAQAGDVREAARRELMEEGGRKEIAMMAPVVFLVLPVTVLFAIYPGMTVLSLGM